MSINFNPRSPHGERRIFHSDCIQDGVISIHALLTESDYHLTYTHSIVYTISIHALLTESDEHTRQCVTKPCDFNPRSPHGERRVVRPFALAYSLISIHALLTESDEDLDDLDAIAGDFNPRSPHGERLPSVMGLPTLSRFQSTLSSRRATRFFLIRATGQNYFNPRSPHGERPWLATATRCPSAYFNPRSPHGERPLLAR